MKYLKKFKNTSDYTDYKAGDNYITPNVILIGEDDIKYHPELINNRLYVSATVPSVIEGESLSVYSICSEYPVNSDITVQYTSVHPVTGNVMVSFTFNLRKGTNISNETLTLPDAQFIYAEDLEVTPERDDVYNYFAVNSI